MIGVSLESVAKIVWLSVVMCVYAMLQVDGEQQEDVKEGWLTDDQNVVAASHDDLARWDYQHETFRDPEDLTFCLSLTTLHRP